MKLFHVSDLHLSFVHPEPGKEYVATFDEMAIAKPMDQRVWSKGNDNYVGYLQKIKNFSEENLTWGDLLIVTGDLTHDMTKKNVLHSIRWLDKCVRGIKVLIRGNHDWGVDFGELRHPDNGLTHTIMIEELSMTCIGKYAFGCYSNHGGSHIDQETGEQPAFNNRTLELLNFAHQLATFARKHKRLPILLSHYPVPEDTALAVSQAGIKAYLSGHVHCTNNKVLPEQADWSWYNKTAAQTDDKVINGCYFSTGTTDVLLNRIGKIIKPITDRIAPPPAPGPKPQQNMPKLKGKVAERMTILVGLPGAGKSTWAMRYIERNPDVVRICQDELGDREACIRACARALSEGKSVVIDRTNIDKRQRAYWVRLAKQYRVKDVTCLFFDIDKDLCHERIQARIGHPTINEKVPAERRTQIIRRFAQDLVTPDISEGFTTIAYLTEKDLDSQS
jgi:predicted kinase/predicted phosphohydrolase